MPMTNDDDDDDTYSAHPTHNIEHNIEHTYIHKHIHTYNAGLLVLPLCGQMQRCLMIEVLRS